MEKKKDDIEDLFKESFNDFEPEVEPKVWNNVKKAIKWGGAGYLIKLMFNKIGSTTIVAITSSAITVIATLFAVNWSKSNQENSSQNSITPNNTESAVVLEQPTKNEFEPAKEKLLTVENNTDLKTLNFSEKKENVSTTKKEEKSSVEYKQEKSFKNTTLKEVKGEDYRKIRSVIKDISKHPFAIISANPVSGSAPLVVNLVNIGTGVENKWIFSDGQKSTTESNPVGVFLNPGTHSIILQSKGADGKLAYDTVQITVVANSSMSTPTNVFSPNDDGIADVFTFQSKNMSKIAAEIYDKTGTLVYKWSGIDGKWDGKTLKGELAPEGNYYYIVNAEGIDGKKYEQKGIIKLAR
jgi:gliding motility-associated-like protein